MTSGKNLLKLAGLESADIPLESNYTLLLEHAGLGVSHERLKDDSPVSDEDLLSYLVHSRVTEQGQGTDDGVQAPDAGKGALAQAE
jgi:hypothetical protein